MDFGREVISEVYSGDWAVQNLEIHRPYVIQSSLAGERDANTQNAEFQGHQPATLERLVHSQE